MKHMTGSMHWNMAYGVLGVSSATQHVMRMTKLVCMQDRQGACSHGNISRETLRCKHRGGREVCMRCMALWLWLRTIHRQVSWTKHRQKVRVHSVVDAEAQQTGLLSFACHDVVTVSQ